MLNVPLSVGLGTSIGTLPHVDAEEAARFVIDRQPRLPAAPSLPNRSMLERRVAQAAWGIDGVSVLPDGSLTLDHDRLAPGSPVTDADFAGEPFVGLRAFVAALAGREGPAKFQLTGPVTLGIALLTAGVEMLDAFRLAASVVQDRARNLIHYLRQQAPGVEPVVFVDEPSLRAVADPNFPLDPESAVDMVSGVLATLEGGAVTGLRCGGGADWLLVQEAGPQILVVPATVDLADQAGALDRFLERGGWVAWSAVTTEGPVGSGVDRLWRRLSGLWCQLVRCGVDPIRLRTQAMVTPLGGLGRHHVGQAATVLQLVDQLAKRLYDQATGLRLSVGA
jgi:hypothetical protein